MQYNIVFSDGSGGVKSVSESLFSAFIKNTIKSNLINLNGFGGGFIARTYSSLRYLLKFKKDDVLILQHFFPIFLGLFLRPLGYKNTEPPRDCRRLIFLREYDNENTKLYP